MSEQIVDIPVEEIRFGIRRARPEEDFSRLLGAVKRYGIKVPIGVVSIEHLPADERKRPDGGLYRYELDYGEGRLTCAHKLKLTTVPAVVKKDTGALHRVMRSLTENVNRRKKSWQEYAGLIRFDLASGATQKDVERKYLLSPATAAKILQVLGHAAPDADLSALELDDAQRLTKLPAKDQTIVLSEIQSSPENAQNAPYLVRKAKELHDVGQFSEQALRASLKRSADELRAERERLKLARRNHAIGPEVIAELLRDADFRRRLESHGATVKANVKQLLKSL